MAERYERLFALPENLYGEGSPVVLAAGALLKDTRTNRVLAQLKFKSISNHKIKALRMKVQPFDVAGALLGEPVAGEYLDLVVMRSEDFGSRAPIALPDASSRSFAVTFIEAIFEDGSSWSGSTDDWAPLPQQMTAKSWLADDNLLKQLCIEYGDQCAYRPDTAQDLWRCACGKINHDSEESCHSCNLARGQILDIDLNILRENMSKRLEAEKAQQLKEEEARSAARDKKKKAAIRFAAIVAAIVAAIILITQVAMPQHELAQAYASAKSLYDSGKYVDAAAAFADLGDYSDAEEMAEQSRAAGYEAASSLFDEGSYVDAKAAFAELAGYKDADGKVAECDKAITYAEGVKLFEDGDYAQAYEKLLNVSDYKDASNMLAKLTLVPQRVDMQFKDEKWQLDITYNDKVRMTNASIAGSPIIYSFSDDGTMLTTGQSQSPDHNYYSYPEGDWIYEQYEVEGGKRKDLYVFDSFGNSVALGSLDPEEESKLVGLDEHHNPKNHWSFDYDEQGNLRRASKGSNNEAVFVYKVMYLPNSSVDSELIWRNIRMILVGTGMFDRWL